MGEWRQDRIGSALRGENPTVLARLTSGFVCKSVVGGERSGRSFRRTNSID